MIKMDEKLEFAKSLAVRAGKIILRNLSNPLNTKFKEDGTPVCSGDKESSEFLEREIRKNYSSFGLLNEEKKRDWKGRDYCWVVDPLDGTIEYINGGRNFGVMIGLLYKSKPILGAVYRPIYDELVYAEKSRGAYLEREGKRRKISVSKNGDLSVLISRFRVNKELEEMLKLIPSKEIKRMSSSFKITEVAKGDFNLFLCPESIALSLWDICAQEIIINEAGGKITDIGGNPIRYDIGLINRQGIVASNGIIHDGIINSISRR